jgi:hypothetical protein
VRTNRQLVTVSSDVSIWLYSVISGLFASVISILIQWAIYADWLHEPGPLRLAGSALTGLCLGALVFRSLLSKREKSREMLERLQTIRWMNDRIRNSLQAIECLTYSGSGDPEVTEHVKSAVDAIENILEDFLADHDSQNALRTNSSQELSQQFVQKQ